MHTINVPNCYLQFVSTDPLRWDRKYTVVDLGEQHDILDKAIVLPEYTELHNILRQLNSKGQRSTLVNCQVTSIAEDDGVGVFAVSFIADGAGGVFAYDVLFAFVFGDSLFEFVPFF